MRRLMCLSVLILSGVFLIPSSTSAGPYLVCDPQPNATRYELVREGSSELIVVPALKGSKHGMAHDLDYLVPLADGDHVYKVRSCNMWSCGQWEQVTVQKLPPGYPANLRVLEKGE